MNKQNGIEKKLSKYLTTVVNKITKRKYKHNNGKNLNLNKYKNRVFRVVSIFEIFQYYEFMRVVQVLSLTHCLLCLGTIKGMSHSIFQ